MMGQPVHLLSGSDYFNLLLDRQMRQKGLAGNISRIHLELSPTADLPQLKSELERDPTLLRVSGLRIALRWPLLPTWKEVTGAAPLVTLHQNLDVATFPTLVLNSPVTDRHTLVRIDLAELADGTKHAVISMHHVLFDHRGMMLFVAAIGTGQMPERFFAAPVAYAFLNECADAVRATLFALRSGGRKLATLVSPHLRPSPTVQYRHVRFSQEETDRIDLHATAIGAGLGKSTFYLAATLLALRDVVAQRGQHPPYWWVPMPNDQRRKGATGHLVGNDLSFLFFRIEDRDLTSMAHAVATINAQMRAQLHHRGLLRYAALLRLFRRVPLGLMDAMVGLSSGGRACSFAFSDLGMLRSPITHFSGIDVLHTAHIPPVPCPPGLNVIMVRENGRLTAVFGHLHEALSTGEVTLLKNRFRVLVISGL